SLPGADHTIFLDYDGHTVEGTSWNGYYNQDSLVAPAYNVDGDAASFNNTELARIAESYERVAEDFRPFNINVTTVDPGVEALRKSSVEDTQWGLRVIMTNEAAMVTDPNERTGAGGIAYVNSFNRSSDTPVWVFTTGGKSVAEAASHEVGHALGLSHDGTSSAGYYRGHGSGEVGWASIMGVGYYKNVSQWDDGTFNDAQNSGAGANYGSGPDDLAIISDVDRNGFGYRDDDAGNTNATASGLGLSGETVSATGIIETTSDVDVYHFAVDTGDVVLNLKPFSVGSGNSGANLDIKADLYDGDGDLIASSNPEDRLDASFDLNLGSGVYYLHVSGVGTGDPTSNTPTGYGEYGSLGQYTIDGTIVPASENASLSIADVEVNEGDGTADVTVTMTGSSASTVTVDYSTSDGTATAFGDYSETTGTLSFNAAGSQTITVSIANDTSVETLESFNITLDNAVGATLTDDSATVSIRDDDVGIEIADVTAGEGDPTANKRRRTFRQFKFEVNLTSPSTKTVTVRYKTADGTAELKNRDYRRRSGRVVFRPGQTRKLINIQAISDDVEETDESFEVRLFNAKNAELNDTIAVGTILDDDNDRDNGGDGIVLDHLWYFEGANIVDSDSHSHANHGHHTHSLGHQHHHHDHDHLHGQGDDQPCTCFACQSVQATDGVTLTSPDDNTSPVAPNTESVKSLFTDTERKSLDRVVTAASPKRITPIDPGSEPSLPNLKEHKAKWLTHDTQLQSVDSFFATDLKLGLERL
ncbi:MAG: Calx-beta domain-containing protein, partial [Planctomycetaceae bacterium]